MTRNDVMDNMDWIPVEINNDEELTLLSAVCQIVEVVKNSHNNPRIYEVAARPIAYIKNLLCLLLFNEADAIIGKRLENV